MSGELDTEGSLLVKGKYSGIIRCSSHVSIDRSAWVESCSLTAASVSVAGRFSGAVEASSTVDFQDRSRVSASVKCQSLRVSPSCRFEGHISMPDLDLQDLRVDKSSSIVDRASGD